MSDGGDGDSRNNSNGASSSDGCIRCGVWCTCNKFNAKTSFFLSTATSLVPKTETIKKAEKEKIEKTKED